MQYTVMQYNVTSLSTERAKQKEEVRFEIELYVTSSQAPGEPWDKHVTADFTK